MIAIIDYGMGNLRSVHKAFQRLMLQAVITDDPKVVEQCDCIILPGVGHFANGMNKLHEMGFVELLSRLVLEEKKPILGICLGMQLMTSFSEEGNVKGLGWIKADTVRFSQEKLNYSYKIPHMGWNNIEVKKYTKLFAGIDFNDPFYFVHSFHVQCHNPDDILCTSVYGNIFTSGFSQNNIIGVQFHPEKSHFAGLTLLKNFKHLSCSDQG